MKRRCALSLLALAGCTGLSQTALAAAEPWPSRSVRIVVPFPPGGGTDIVGRAMGQALAPRLGQAVVIDNKPGASTLIGTEAVTRAAPDGYTLLVSGSTTFSVNPALKPRLNYDPFKDLSAVAVLARAPLVVVVPAQSPFKTLPELLNAARRQAGSVRYATYGSATAPHLAGLLLGLSAGVTLQDIPYKGSAQVSTALMSGEVEATFDTVASAGPLIKAGKLRALATPSRVRVSSLPQVPTLTELGLPDASFEGWYAMAAPAGTPAPVLERLGRELRAVMALPEVQKQFRAQALEPVYQDPATMTRLMEQEITQFRAAAARAHLTLE
ncbi:Bug family tripartite tricarboxylate transporter substrate binding protein [Curvibacter gracilis]|uniref:Bug family tripartite tricarboxylate transporter substrate binding protein n=1 Tax=Curvibacter gracilis TaxID=230310 RepID=UPI0004893BCC|nr:tripartite tricarboxylate transporter substrate binding protein [Curvibacter gracilis]